MLGLIAFAFGTAAGVLFGKLMCKVTPVSYTHLEVYKRQIYDIPIVEITEQYLDYIRQMQT